MAEGRGAAGIALLACPACGTPSALAFRPVLAWASCLDPDVVHGLPYEAHVLVPVQATALEPAAATVALAAPVWDGLPGGGAAGHGGRRWCRRCRAGRRRRRRGAGDVRVGEGRRVMCRSGAG